MRLYIRQPIATTAKKKTIAVAICPVARRPMKIPMGTNTPQNKGDSGNLSMCIFMLPFDIPNLPSQILYKNIEDYKGVVN